MKKIIPLIIGTMVFSANALADDDALVMDDDVDTIRIQQKSDYTAYKVPKRTSFFSGMEYTEYVSEEFPKTENIKFVVADGSTRLHPNWRFRYVLSQLQNKSGNPQTTAYKKTNFTLAPRYEQWVNHRFSFFAEPVYVHQSDPYNSLTSTEIKLKPGLQFTFGKHSLNTIYTYSMIEKETENENINKDFDTFEAKATYIYRYTPRVNFGLEFTRAGNVDDSAEGRRRSFTIKPAVRFKHWQGIVTELNTSYNYNESGVNLNGSETIKYNVNNNYPLNKNIKIVANVAYATVKLHEGGYDKNKDKEGFGVKLGLNLSF